MRYFTVSKKGRKGYNFVEMGYTYELDVDMFGKMESFLIHADNRKAAVETAEVIVATITFESTTRTVQATVNQQNGLQQLKVAYRMLDTHDDKDKVYDYIKRLKVHFNILDEVEQAEKEQKTLKEQEEQPAQEQTEENALNVTNEITEEISYTAYNRSFSTYEEANEYCLQSDLDPELIQVDTSASHTATIEPVAVTEQQTQSEVFHLYSHTFNTYWEAYNYAIKNRIDSIDMIISSNASITNEQLLKLKSEYVSSKYSMSYENVTMYYKHLSEQPSNKHVNDMLYSLKSLKERHEYRLEAERKREEEQIKMIQEYEILLKTMHDNGMTKVENGYSVKFYYKDECIYSYYSGIQVSKLYNDLLDIYNNKIETVTQ